MLPSEGYVPFGGYVPFELVCSLRRGMFLSEGYVPFELRLIDSSCPCCFDHSLDCFMRKSTTTTTTSTTTTTTAKPNTTASPCCDYSSSSSESDESDERGVILAIGIHNKSPEKARFFQKALKNSQKLQDCSPSDCNSNGHCFGSTSEPLCLCRLGYCGPRCNTTSCSGDSACNDHGWCLATTNSSQCICQSGWSGKFCQKKD
uniref:EGF-like domain-containing protein n=1 Tax=Meloidogyne enterolobii TaxID=390850 RepID=A0A6V7TVQ2_MELEN|nr:unnamed protein product [Meloidogyne enterolobii]